MADPLPLEFPPPSLLWGLHKVVGAEMVEDAGYGGRLGKKFPWITARIPTIPYPVKRKGPHPSVCFEEPTPHPPGTETHYVPLSELPGRTLRSQQLENRVTGESGCLLILKLELRTPQIFCPSSHHLSTHQLTNPLAHPFPFLICPFIHPPLKSVHPSTHLPIHPSTHLLIPPLVQVMLPKL